MRLALTDGGEDISETEVVHSIEGQQVVQKLLLLIITAKEGIPLVKFSVGNIWFTPKINIFSFLL